MAMQWHFLSYLPVITTVCGLLTVYVSTVIFYVSHDTATYHRDEGMGMIRSLSDASSRAPEYNFFAPLAALTAYLGFTCSVLGGMLIWDCCPAAVPCCDLLLLRLVVLAYWVLGALWAIGVYGVGFVSSAADSEQHPENQAHFIFFGLFFICYISQSLLYLGVLRRASTKGLVRFPLVRQVFSLFCLVAACSCLIGFLMSPNQSSIQVYARRAGCVYCAGEGGGVRPVLCVLELLWVFRTLCYDDCCALGFARLFFGLQFSCESFVCPPFWVLFVYVCACVFRLSCVPIVCVSCGHRVRVAFVLHVLCLLIRCALCGPTCEHCADLTYAELRMFTAGFDCLFTRTATIVRFLFSLCEVSCMPHLWLCSPSSLVCLNRRVPVFREPCLSVCRASWSTSCSPRCCSVSGGSPVPLPTRRRRSASAETSTPPSTRRTTSSTTCSTNPSPRTSPCLRSLSGHRPLSPTRRGLRRRCTPD